MKRTLKALLVWLVLLVLPLQGYASATQLPCAAGVSAAHEECADADDATPSSCDHDHAPSPHHHAKCGTCATCCTGAAIIGSASLSVTPAFAASTPIPFAGAVIASVDLALPERPPRA